MFENKISSEKDSGIFDVVSGVRNNTDEKVLEEVVEYVIANHNNPTKMVEALSIAHDGKNILMLLLEMKDFQSIKKLFTVAPIIFSNPRILSHQDSNGENVLGYFIEYGTAELLEDFMSFMQAHCPANDIKTIIKNRRQDGRTPLMTLCANHKFKEVDIVFKTMIDCLASVCGLDSMYNAMTVADAAGDNLLMIAIKNDNFSIGTKILDLISKTIKEPADKSKIEHEIVMSCDTNSNNSLMLLASKSCSESSELQNKILEIIQSNPEAVLSLTRANSDGNNAVMIAIMSKNIEVAEKILKIIQSIQKNSKGVILGQICDQHNKNNDNFITLAFKYHCTEFYLNLMDEVEGNIGEEKVNLLFKNTLSSHDEFLHSVFSSSNTNAIISVMKYIKRVKNLSDDDKEGMSNLIMKKDNMNRTLLNYAVESSNVEVCKLILDIAKEFCDPLTIKLILTSRDSKGQTPYVLSTIQKNQKIQKCIEEFANSTGNAKYVESQTKEIVMIKKQQLSGIFALSVKSLH
jgi:ankyrin repeat protein